MTLIKEPIIHEIKDTKIELALFEQQLRNGDDEKTKNIILSFPTVYIHNWKSSKKFDVYIGETNDIVKRTNQHYDLGTDTSNWQNNLIKKNASLFIIGHDHFNKSLTLDIENRLMQYMMSVENVNKVHNLRGNPQNDYYPIEELDVIFRKIWSGLRKKNKELFPTESSIRDSAIFKASPLHKLTKEQLEARNLIIEKVEKAIKNDEKGQLIFVEGEAGTGKTVLNSSTFYELYCQAEEQNKHIRCHLLVNHDEQITVYKQIAEKLGLTEKYGDVVGKPTSFINNNSTDNPVDIVFVDEAHLLLTQGKQSYQGKNQLEDIIKRAKVTVVMFDENQILTTEQIWENKMLDEYRKKAIDTDNHIRLNKQLRIQANKEIVEWIDSFTQRGIVNKIPKCKGDYILKIMDSPIELEKEVEDRARKEDSALSRMVATYDWEYSSKNRPNNRLQKYWQVMIDDWSMPWNYELERGLSRKEKKNLKGLSWAEQAHTINEIGSTFTIQGFDLNYVGVILGPSVKFRDGKIVYDPSESFNRKATRNRTLSNGTKRTFGEKLLKNEVRVLLTRGVNGLFIYACDEALRNELKKASI